MKKLLLLASFLLSTPIFAALWIEPFAGLGIGTSEATASASGLNYPIKYAYSGTDYGARLGLRFLGLLAGVHYDTMKSASLKLKDASGLTGLADTKNDFTNIGVYAGYELPILLKAWGTYYLSSRDKRSDKTVQASSGYSLGLGLRPPLPLPFISIYLNAEYRQFSYDDYSVGTIKIKDTKKKEFLMTISLPITI